MKIDTGIPARQRAEIARGLSRLLADTYLLYLKTHSFHWNVEGPMFQTLHQMFMEQYTETWNAIDLIAERIRSLGEYAPGTYREYTKLTRIRETEGFGYDEVLQGAIYLYRDQAQTARIVYDDVKFNIPIDAKVFVQPANAKELK